jgi:hypothetical protein
VIRLPLPRARHDRPPPPTTPKAPTSSYSSTHTLNANQQSVPHSRRPTREHHYPRTMLPPARATCARSAILDDTEWFWCVYVCARATSFTDLALPSGRGGRALTSREAVRNIVRTQGESPLARSRVAGAGGAGGERRLGAGRGVVEGGSHPPRGAVPAVPRKCRRSIRRVGWRWTRPPRRCTGAAAPARSDHSVES